MNDHISKLLNFFNQYLNDLSTHKIISEVNKKNINSDSKLLQNHAFSIDFKLTKNINKSLFQNKFVSKLKIKVFNFFKHRI